ncbi:MAG: hypothetical protein HIU82_12565 [Proteobacteria bacterium]|nr:hypothetical protein [Pseudomonadota bacterium]
MKSWEFVHSPPVAEEAPPTEAPHAAAMSPTGAATRWTRWRGETGEEFAARVTAEAARLGLVRVRFITGV